jgi:hypothetical protein
MLNFKTLISAFICVHIIGNVVFAQSVRRDVEWVGFDLSHFTPISKITYGGEDEMTCVPISLLNSLLVSPISKDVFLNPISGTLPSELAQTVNQLASEVTPNVRSHGMSIAQTIQILQKFMPKASSFSLEPMSLKRNEGETPNDHLRRIHEALKRSIQNDFAPLITIVGINVVAKKAKTSDYLWNSDDEVNHAVTVTAIESEISNWDNSFQIEIIDSDTGVVSKIFVFSPEKKRGFNTDVPTKFTEDGTTWTTWSGDIRLEKPLLVIEGSEINLGNNKREWWARHIDLISTAVGVFN